MNMKNNKKNVIEIKDLTLAYGSNIIQENLNFTVQEQDIFVIMGASGCGKSSLLRVLMGLLAPAQGSVSYNGVNFWAQDENNQKKLLRNIGVMFQGGALWTSRTLAENIAIPLEHYTNLTPKQIVDVSRYKLAQVGLSDFGDYYPSEISGGMRKRAGIARAMALDPQYVFFDEPSAGLDPISAAQLDELILQLRDSLGMTMLIVSHELASIFSIANNSILLDAKTKTFIAKGSPCDLLGSENEEVQTFLRRGKKKGEGTDPLECL